MNQTMNYEPETVVFCAHFMSVRILVTGHFAAAGDDD